MIRVALLGLLAVPVLAAEPLTPVATLGFAEVSGRGTFLVSPDGKTVVVSGRWYDWTTGENIPPPFPRPEGGRWEALLTDGHVHVVTTDGFRDTKYAIHDGKTGEVLHEVKRPNEKENHPILFSANGRTAVTRTPDRDKWRLWAAVAPAWEWKPLDDESDWPLAISADGARVCWTTQGESRKAFAHSLATGKTRELEAEGILSGIVVSPDGAQACVDTTAGYRWFDADGGKVVRDVEVKAESGRRFDPTFTADGKRLVLFDNVGRWELYPARADAAPDLVSPPVDELNWKAAVRIVRPGERLFVRNAHLVVREYDLLTGKRRDKHSSSLPRYEHVAAIDNRRAIAWTEAGRYAIWDADTGKVIRDGALPTEDPDAARKDRAVTFERVRASGDGKTLLAFGHYPFSPVAHVRVEDGKPADPKATTPWVANPPVFLRDGRTFALLQPEVADDTRTFLTDPKTGKAVGTLPLPDWNCHDPRFDIHPDGRTAIRADAALGVYELATGKLRWSGALGTPALAAAFADGGRRIVAVCGDGVSVFDTRTRRREVIEWVGGTSWTLSADARWVARTLAGGGLYLDLLDTATADDETRRVRLPLGTDDDEPAAGVAFTPDGKRVLTCSANGVCRAWDVSEITGRPPANPPAEAALAPANLWELLASDDAKTAGEVMQVLTAAPELARKTIAEHLTPVPVADTTAVAARIADLGSKDFRTRDAATKALAAVADQVEGKLRAALDASDSAEARERLKALLAQQEARAIHPDTIRMIRAMEVLESVGDAEAKALVAKLASGAPRARLTELADDARKRMK